MSQQIFKLFSNCIPVKGASRYIICDLLRREIYFIPEGLHEILTEYEDKSLDFIKQQYDNEVDSEIDEFIDFLLANELGFYTNNPENFPKIEKRWEWPGLLSNAILEVSARSAHDYPHVFRQLDQCGCKHLELRFYCEMPMEEVERILSAANHSLLRSIDLYLKYTPVYDAIDFNVFLIRFQKVGRLVLHSCNNPHKLAESTPNIFYCEDSITDNSHCGMVKSVYFHSNMAMFMEAQFHNSCLNKKISITEDGNIKNCPSLPGIFGNVYEDSLKDIVAGSKDLKKYWNTTKDQINVCRDCEFRYVCTDCRAYLEDPSDANSKPLKCGYNPYEAVWEEWSTHPLKQEAICHYAMQNKPFIISKSIYDEKEESIQVPAC